MSVNLMIDFINQKGGANFLAREFAEMAIEDQFTGLENRLARNLRASNEKPLKVESVPCSYEDELSGDHYSDKALFFANGNVEVVSYKGEGVCSFDSAVEYEEYVQIKINNFSECDYFDDDLED